MTHALAFAPADFPEEFATAPVDDDAAWLRGRTVVHKLVLAVVEPTPCLAALLAEVGRVGGELQSLTLHPVGRGAFEAVLRITRLGPDEAAALMARLARRPDVRSAALEHILIS